MRITENMDVSNWEEVRYLPVDRIFILQFLIVSLPVLKRQISELGKLVTGQDYNGDAKACMDQIAKLVDAKVEEAELI